MAYSYCSIWTQIGGRGAVDLWNKTGTGTRDLGGGDSGEVGWEWRCGVGFRSCIVDVENCLRVRDSGVGMFDVRTLGLDEIW